jgi:hypothetical protein
MSFPSGLAETTTTDSAGRYTFDNVSVQPGSRIA